MVTEGGIKKKTNTEDELPEELKFNRS